MKLVRDVARTDTKQAPVNPKKINWSAADTVIKQHVEHGHRLQDLGRNKYFVDMLQSRVREYDKKGWPTPEDAATHDPGVVELRVNYHDRKAARHDHDATVARYRAIAEAVWSPPAPPVS